VCFSFSSSKLKGNKFKVLKMTNISLYFQVHQPYRVRRFTVFDISKSDSYFDETKNFEVFEKVAKKCYIPTTKMLIELLRKYPDFKVAFSFSGVFLDQAKSYSPELLSLFKKICTSKNVEVLDETYYHSLAFIHSKEEYKQQILLHREQINSLFSKIPSTFRNTELVYSNEIANFASELGYEAILAEGADFVLKGDSPNKVYTNPNKTISILLKNYRLSDDIAFRFSDKNWKEWPLSAEKYMDWIGQAGFGSDIINLFMDYETFGEHQWEDTGIFKFFNKFIEYSNKFDHKFFTPSQSAKTFIPEKVYDVPFYLSWADTERDLSAWIGNSMQQNALTKIYEIEGIVKKSNDKELIEKWRKLQTSDHFYYMCTKYFNDGDVHKYFSPYETPYDAFVYFMNVFSDIKCRAEEIVDKKNLVDSKIQNIAVKQTNLEILDLS